jgi:hypothetical protein
MKIKCEPRPAPAFRPITISVTFETEDEARTYLDAIGPTSQSTRSGALKALAPKAPLVGCEMVSILLGRLWDDLDAEMNP